MEEDINSDEEVEPVPLPKADHSESDKISLPSSDPIHENSKYLPVPISNYPPIQNQKLKNIVEYIESSGNYGRRKIENLREYDNGNDKEKEVNEILKYEILEIMYKLYYLLNNK